MQIFSAVSLILIFKFDAQNLEIQLDASNGLSGRFSPTETLEWNALNSLSESQIGSTNSPLYRLLRSLAR